VDVAEHLGRRFGAGLRVLTADAHPAQALVEASREADLLVVGSRGLRGLKALGSVSERVAHEASCSVLVVRTRTT
jgi:nucleotide-binding universal stress UspA family protein